MQSLHLYIYYGVAYFGQFGIDLSICMCLFKKYSFSFFILKGAFWYILLFLLNRYLNCFYIMLEKYIVSLGIFDVF